MLAAIVAFLLLAGTALAAAPPGTDPNSEVAKWFRSLQNIEGQYCCGEADCRAYPWREGKDGYEVLDTALIPNAPASEQWLPVPPSHVVRVESPYGFIGACILHWSEQRSDQPNVLHSEIRCFIPPPEG